MATTTSKSSSASNRAAEAAHETVDKIAEQAEKAEEKIRKAANDAETRIKETKDVAQDKSAEIADHLGQTIREHPLASVGIAFAAGYLISTIFRR